MFKFLSFSKNFYNNSNSDQQVELMAFKELLDKFGTLVCLISGVLKFGTAKNREFRVIPPCSKTCNVLKIRNFEEFRRFSKHAIS